ncbi:MAG: diphthine--ammonia ligase [Candidatus Woesearchaeota archaeon]|jgi:asparagine synthase (glutamine-hydrolysing)
MCGIIGFYNYKNASKLVLNGLKIMKNRGLDGFGIATEKNLFTSESIEVKHKEKTTKNNKLSNNITSKKLQNLKLSPSDLKEESAIGHNLHSIVNFVIQPLISNNSRFAINGEIYNWEELNNKYNFNARNDSEVAFKLLEQKGISALEEFDGVYAFCYQKKDKVYLARDLFGVKPIWYALTENLAFASEKKALIKQKIQNIEELNPRVIIEYDIKTKKTDIIKRDFLTITPEHTDTHKELIERTRQLVTNAIKKRIPHKPFGILFSGGIDSTVIAYVCKQLGLNFTCYTAAVESEQEAPDLTYAKKVAKELELDLKFKVVKLKDVEKYIKKVVPLIEDSNVTKVGVGLTFYVACELAKKDNIKVIFSGLGSEEIFAGYDRHKKSQNVNEECLSGLRKIYERDMYRDDVITMNHNLELRLPFLDKTLADFALKIPAKYKLTENNISNKFSKDNPIIQSKVILRDVAKKIGISNEISERPKKAAQYGSYFDKALQKLSHKKGFKFRSEYLKQFYPYPNLKLAALVSGGKDSLYAMHIMQKQNYEISCFITIDSENKDSYMYHTPNIEMAKLQAESCNIPIIVQKTKGDKEEELADLEIALKKAIENYKIEGVTCGAIFSNYQRTRVEKICDKLGLKIFTPLWHMNQELLLRNLIEEGFEFIISSIAADGLDKSFLRKTITEKEIDKLVEINKKIGLNVAGEGGEYESLVIDAPFFNKKIVISDSKTVLENSCTGKFLITSAKLE